MHRKSSDFHITTAKLPDLLNRKSSLPLPGVRFRKTSAGGLFADDCVEWTTVESENARNQRQNDIDESRGTRTSKQHLSNQIQVEQNNKMAFFTKSDVQLTNKPNIVERPSDLLLEKKSAFTISIHDDHYGTDDLIVVPDHTAVQERQTADVMVNTDISPVEPPLPENDFDSNEKVKWKGMLLFLIQNTP